jgi:hypothetical protein
LILSGQYKALGAAIGVTRGNRIARVPARGVLRAIADYVMDTCAHDEAALAGHSRYVSQWRRLPPERSERRITSQGPLFGKSRFAGQGVWKQLIVVQIICSIGRPRYRNNPVVERRHHANSEQVFAFNLSTAAGEIEQLHLTAPSQNGRPSRIVFPPFWRLPLRQSHPLRVLTKAGSWNERDGIRAVYPPEPRPD